MRPLITLFVLAPVLAGCGQKEASPEALCRDLLAEKGYRDLKTTYLSTDSGGASMTFDEPGSTRRLTCEVNRGKIVELTADGEIIYQDLK